MGKKKRLLSSDEKEDIKAFSGTEERALLYHRRRVLAHKDPTRRALE